MPIASINIDNKIILLVINAKSEQYQTIKSKPINTIRTAIYCCKNNNIKA